MSRTTLSGDAKDSSRPRRTDLLDLLAVGDPPAFAVDDANRIVFWNKGAERLMERSASQALGRLCHEVFSGRDHFGNIYCHQTCAAGAALKRGESVNRFEITIGGRPQPRCFGFTMVEVPGTRPGFGTVVHLMDQVDRESRLAREIARLRETSVTDLIGDSGKTAPLRRQSKSTQRTDPSADAEVLSERENEVLNSISAGLPNKEIAQRLGISVATVRNHVQRILRKLDVHSKLEAVSLVFRTRPSPHDKAAASLSIV
ncbi:MAG: LuxR C-terminal-related transcriptional regulator [Vicinamibacteria bacterium]